METRSYTVTSPLKCDGERYAVGDPIELTSARGAHLVAAGAVKAPERDAEELAGEAAELEREQAIAEAIGQLDPENPDHFTKGGKPEVAAVEAITGFDISAKERDQVWERQKQGG